MKDKSNWVGLPKKITALVESESDRGAILILGSYLEEILGDVIDAHCVSTERAQDITGLRRPAGDFDSKIRVAVAFGFIHGLEAEALHCVRKIRNNAAHFDFDASDAASMFGGDSITDQTANLASKVNLSLPSRDRDAVRGLFIASCRLVAIRLMGRAIEAKRPVEPKTLNEAAAEYRERTKGTPQGAILQEIEDALREGDPSKMKEVVDAMGEAIRTRLKGRA